MKDFKIKISCPEHSEFVQKKLFKLGISWASRSKDILHTDEPFLFVENKTICFSTRGCKVYGEGFFNEKSIEDRTDHPDWCWPRSHALGDIKERVARNAGTKHKKDKIPLYIKAERYIAENPEIYKLFRRFSWEAIYAGRETLSACFITGRIRWESMLIGNDEQKINNDYRAYMARKFMAENPHLGKVFRTRLTKKEKGEE